MKVKILFVFVLVLLVSSCGEYEKLLKSTDYELKKAKAKEYYDARQYTRTTELLGQILPRYRATEEAEELNWMNAQSYLGMKDYFMAGSYYKQFIENFPFGRHIEEATFMAPFCDYKISSRPELDQQSTRDGIEGFSIFITRFPNNSRVEEAKTLIKELEEKLVEKSYKSARLYYDMKQYRAAVVALNNSLRDNPDTKYREEMMFLKLNSLFMYAELSLPAKQRERYQAALDDYYSFMEEFPKSTYAREVSNIFEKTERFLNNGKPAVVETSNQ
jgi:outer membrane protein assembly factor BamD